MILKKVITKEMTFWEFVPEHTKLIGLHRSFYAKMKSGEQFIGSLLENHVGTVFFNSGSFNYKLDDIKYWTFLPNFEDGKGEGVPFEHDVKKEADEEFAEIRGEYDQNS